MIFIPEGLVSMIIGTRGKQIRAFMDESHAEIVVNQPIIGMTQRSVQIKGNPKSVAQATYKIYQMLESMAHTVEDIDKIAVRLS